jgi:ABC-type Zn uptake system ZnuABC Zn-binding protein ZnuA
VRPVLAGLAVTGLLLSGVLTSACASREPEGDRLTVVASFPLIGELATRIGGDAVEVITLVPLGVDEHAYQPTTEAARDVVRADLVLVNGYRLEESLLGLITQNVRAGVPVVAVSRGLEPLEGGDDHDHGEGEARAETAEAALGAIDRLIHEVEDGDLTAEEALEEIDEIIHRLPAAERDDAISRVDTIVHDFEAGRLAAKDAIEAIEDILDPGGGSGERPPLEGIDPLLSAEGDPHFWLDARHMAAYAANVRDALIAVDPANADGYRARATEAIASLRALHAELETALSAVPPERRKIVVFHDAYQYFAAAYGFEVIGSVAPANPNQAASAAAIAEIVRLVRSEGIPTLYREPQYSAQSLDLIARESGARVGILHSIPSDAAPTYAEMMRANARALVEGLAR